ncbi:MULTISPECIES: bifunctional 4-hydroxy-2-oxoglutarate aldolase/2-dehydro-3-deoxy-phosphogluconate aldolase [Bacillus]|uniref:Bifunctional 4-hydroxy-2-oxoglutarate aldolase/2-dehydro-3-deoxy-phosphogluconate aldolase n=1 Tax=Bacillus glycinifermentans TaxID=1664069 RepID=A0AAJ3Z387_9BACI|nr:MULTISPECIES: bifunctional 4-hydroxy-2-oxoglutarate aldolase/2-dehydro-3-deoxy-phosphogluconate aldolase [Bacillus]KKB74431.1 2-dehydro-3-deoxyphosphogluconate aldolase [Bacillus sp. TH008]MDU0070329.1 bifunctional 4-hydroxy-2-oxoglutarate aldolase/2-dehydro-3-deoxy-phosphogluconate aldolase [Bacillus sp. IG6]MED8018229.1 bifunctional 4-hydroxy-2-oxoglutarate aldolase/2-dehydro-3-deoxy-phosphogluconate aldolase [Bacillus glycinifermentans]QAT67267.1 bifunctional 4-hydroxy-2-oxoglutarate aldo
MEMSMIEKTQEQLADAGLIAVIRAKDAEAAEAVIHRLIDKGITAIEVTYTTPGASNLIEKFAKIDGLLVGAGTVINADQAREAADAGAKFIVSPGFSGELADDIASLHTFFIPGVITPSEIMEAVSKGFRILKLFPGGTSGVSYMKNLAGPFPDIRFIPTGGIHPGDVEKWLDAGALAVGVGSQLDKASEEDLQRIFKRTKQK